MTTRGAVNADIQPENVGSKTPAHVARVTGGNSILNEELSNEKATVTLKEAVPDGIRPVWMMCISALPISNRLFSTSPT